ncbi:MAG TPA: type II secretion system protein [Vicinamibacterales bacterium]|nr:type II secretion system protein [Vicinamibacterales bacterium]
MKRADRHAPRSRAAGFALIDLLFVCFMIGILSAIALPPLMTAKEAASAASAIGSMRAIGSGQLTYALSCGDGFYAPNLVTLGTAPPRSREAFVSADLGSANIVIKSNYRIQMSGAPFAPAPVTCNGLGGGMAAEGFKAGADPLAPEVKRFFGTNSGGLVYENTSSLYATMPEVGAPPAGTLIH